MDTGRSRWMQAFAACALLSLLCSGTCRAQSAPPTAATPLDLNDGEIAWRIGFISDRLEASRKHASIWHWSWTAIDAGGMAWGIAEAAHDDDTDDRGFAITQASKSFIGLVDLYWIRPMYPRLGASELTFMPQATHTQKLAKLRKAEDILKRNAARVDDRYDWRVHVASILVNFAGAGAVWATGGGTGDALISAFSGIGAAELMFWTEPGQPLRDLADYENLTGGSSMSVSSAPSQWRLVAIPGGLAVARSF